MSEMILEIQNGNKNFEYDSILANINLQIKPGDFISLLGPSGSGKTTLIRLLAGLDNWTSGEFKSNSTLKSSFVFQEPNLLGWRTVFENINLPLELGEKKTDHQTLKNILKTVNLEPVSRHYPQELSGGMKMRASIARALITKPNLLFMDEPFAALDEPTREKLQEKLREIWELNSTTIVFVTHSIQEATFLSNRIIFLSGKPATIKKDYEPNLPKIRDSSTRSSIEYYNELKNIRALYNNNPESRDSNES